MPFIPTVTLNIGGFIPLLGFGTYAAIGKDTTDSAVESIDRDFRHIDTTAFYNCENAVGEGIKQSVIDRSQLLPSSRRIYPRLSCSLISERGYPHYCLVPSRRRNLNPSAGSNLLTHPNVKAIADAHNATTGQVLIAWSIQRGVSVIPKSSSPARIAQNIDIITLTDAEMNTLNDHHKLETNPQRVAKNGSKEKTVMGWTFEEMGWEEKERI